MASVNRVTLIGNVGAAPETRSTGSGDTVCTIRMATSESWTDKASGEKKEITEWHRVFFYRKQAELVKQLVKKGSQLYVEGRLKTRKWTDKDSVERYITEIEAVEFQLLGSRSQSSGNSDEHGSTEPAPSSSRNQQSTGARNAAGGGRAYGDSDIPF
jgi:single-strand DNA-binding protein